MYQLLGKPITDDPDFHSAYVASIGNIKPFYVGVNLVTLQKKVVFCNHCKSDTHRGYQCPLPNTPGWRGAELDPFVPKAPASSPLASKGRGGGRGAAQNSRGGSPIRGGRNKGGWTTVSGSSPAKKF